MRIPRRWCDPWARRRSDASKHSVTPKIVATPSARRSCTVAGELHRGPADRRRRRRLPAELLARHARVARRDLPRDPRGRGATGRHVAILQDLSGPKIRTGPLAGGEPLELTRGRRAAHRRRRRGRRAGPRSSRRIAELIRSAKPGDRLLLDDGRIELRVVARRRRARRPWSSTAGRSASTRASSARRRAAGVGGHGEGRRGSAVRPRARRRLRRAELRPDRRRCAARAQIMRRPQAAACR